MARIVVVGQNRPGHSEALVDVRGAATLFGAGAPIANRRAAGALFSVRGTVSETLAVAESLIAFVRAASQSSSCSGPGVPSNCACFAGETARGGAVLVGLGVAAVVVASPFVRLAYHEPALHVVIETAPGIAALAIAYLFFLRFRVEGRSADLLLAGTYGVAALVNTFLLAVPAAMEAQPRVFSAWAPTIGRSLVVLGLLTAAFHRVPSLRPRVPSGWTVALMCVAVVGVIAAVVALTEGSLPVGVDANVTPTAGRVPDLDGHPVIIGVQVVSMVALFAAAVGFIGQADRRDDELMAWLAASVAVRRPSQRHVTVDRRPVVGDDQLEVEVVLRQHGLDRLADELRRVARHAHGDGRCHR